MRLLLDERFDAPALDEAVWVCHYLPQWTTPGRSLARYTLGPDGLRLLVEHDQQAWRPEDGGLRVSNLQTAVWSGPAGSARGTHRHRDGLRVRTPQPARHLVVPVGGRAEATLRASADPAAMLAFWLVGVEDASPDDSGELCVAELFGDAVGPAGSAVNVGVKAHHDPRLVDDMTTLRLDLDATRWHTYAVEWSATDPLVRFLVDDVEVRVVEQCLGYGLQVMLDLFELPDRAGGRAPGEYPRWGDVRSVRVWSER